MGTPPGHRRRSRLGAQISLPVLVVLGTVDLLFLTASVVPSAGGGIAARQGPWSVTTEGGWSEQFGYVKEGVLVMALLLLRRLTGRWVWSAWAAVFACILIDDSRRLHERLGIWFAATADLPEGVAGLRGQDLGELAAWTLVGVAPLTAVVWLHRHSDRPTRRASLGLGALLCTFAFFGVAVDALHAVLTSVPLRRLTGVVEDGGELVVLSVAVAYVVAEVEAARRHRRPPPPGSPGQRPARSPAAASSSPA